MAHTTHKLGGDTLVAHALITITSYTHGGEQIPLSELGLTGSIFRVFLLSTRGIPVAEVSAEWVPPPIPTQTFVTIRLFQDNGTGTDVELPTTASLNRQFLMVVALVGS